MEVVIKVLVTPRATRIDLRMAEIDCPFQMILMPDNLAYRVVGCPTVTAPVDREQSLAPLQVSLTIGPHHRAAVRSRQHRVSIHNACHTATSLPPQMLMAQRRAQPRNHGQWLPVALTGGCATVPANAESRHTAKPASRGVPARHTIPSTPGPPVSRPARSRQSPGTD